MMSRPNNDFNDSFVCYQDLSEYVGLSNIEWGFHGEPALKKHNKTEIELQPHLALQRDI